MNRAEWIFGTFSSAVLLSCAEQGNPPEANTPDMPTVTDIFARTSATSVDIWNRANGGLGANWTTWTGNSAPSIVSSFVFAGIIFSARSNSAIEPKGSRVP